MDPGAMPEAGSDTDYSAMVPTSVPVDCPICLEHPRDTLLVPCGHLLCKRCSEMIDACPICRAEVRETHRAFL